MANLGAPVKVSPIIKGARWSSLILGYYYGKQKLSAYKIIDAEDKKHKAELRKERAAKLAKEKKLKEVMKKARALMKAEEKEQKRNQQEK